MYTFRGSPVIVTTDAHLWAAVHVKNCRNFKVWGFTTVVCRFADGYARTISPRVHTLEAIFAQLEIPAQEFDLVYTKGNRVLRLRTDDDLLLVLQDLSFDLDQAFFDVSPRLRFEELWHRRRNYPPHSSSSSSSSFTRHLADCGRWNHEDDRFEDRADVGEEGSVHFPDGSRFEES